MRNSGRRVASKEGRGDSRECEGKKEREREGGREMRWDRKKDMPFWHLLGCSLIFCRVSRSAPSWQAQWLIGSFACAPVSHLRQRKGLHKGAWRNLALPSRDLMQVVLQRMRIDFICPSDFSNQNKGPWRHLLTGPLCNLCIGWQCWHCTTLWKSTVAVNTGKLRQRMNIRVYSLWASFWMRVVLWVQNVSKTF